jgi:AmiR/NasT family two-component response regulator
MPITVLLDLADAGCADWMAALDRTNPHEGTACDSRNLVQRTMVESPTLVLCRAAGLTPRLEAALADWHGEPPCAVLLLTPPGAMTADAAARAAELGVHHWQEVGADVDASALEAARATALARWRREHALRAALATARDHLDERKWIDRAKGVLMSAREMSEDDAFRLLRSAAMNVNVRVGELSRAVFETAQWAEAVNRAGQLRMLSQRLVRAAAQRLLKLDERAAAAIEQQSAQRVRDNLEMLVRQCAGTGAQDDCDRAVQRWEALARALAAPRIDVPALLRLDRCAEDLLSAAERLTDALQRAAGRRALHIVNECGRQRMRVQRVAKESLLAALHRSDAEARALSLRRDAALDEFERAQRDLEQAPLSSALIRATLVDVRDEWLRLLGGLRGAEAGEPGNGRRALVHASEVLLDRLDALTAAYEHSLQVIMG